MVTRFSQFGHKIPHQFFTNSLMVRLLNRLLALCSLGRSHWCVSQFEKLGVNNLLDQLGKVFNDRYQNSESDPSINPDQTWFSERLREAAMKMEPLCITPTGLKSPTNDSNPPDDPLTWKSATLNDTKIDYFLMPLGGDPEKSSNVQMRQASEITSEYIHGLDGSFLGKRRRCISGSEEEEEEGEWEEEEEEEEEQVSKRRK
ncbi:hypothetical protein BYT27DRAFT_7198097 [Phlegmacium glaucopus]|nr:hypothetical protein BYT27DRAFT_7198097 [Phlegmacium glaucopus]